SVIVLSEDCIESRTLLNLAVVGLLNPVTANQSASVIPRASSFRCQSSRKTFRKRSFAKTSEWFCCPALAFCISIQQLRPCRFRQALRPRGEVRRPEFPSLREGASSSASDQDCVGSCPIRRM